MGPQIFLGLSMTLCGMKLFAGVALSVYKHVPPQCRSLFRELGNIVFLEATTGQIGAVKASVMFARAILYVPLHGLYVPQLG